MNAVAETGENVYLKGFNGDFWHSRAASAKVAAANDSASERAGVSYETSRKGACRSACAAAPAGADFEGDGAGGLVLVPGVAAHALGQARRVLDDLAEADDRDEVVVGDVACVDLLKESLLLVEPAELGVVEFDLAGR